MRFDPLKCCNRDQLTSRHSIVAVHGLNPFGRKNHSLRAWSNGEHVWLRDAFPSKEPKARVMLYEYNANLMFRSSVAGVYEWADKLLGVLGIERQVLNSESCGLRSL